MDPLNHTLNRINSWNNHEDDFKCAITTRASNLFVAAPIEVVAIAQNILLTPIYALSTIVKRISKSAALISGSQAIKDFAEKLPGLTDFLRAIVRVIAYSIGALLTATLGVISPQANFKVHCALGLVRKEQDPILVILDEIETIEEAKLAAQREAEKKAEEIAVKREKEALQLAEEVAVRREKEALQQLENAYKKANQSDSSSTHPILQIYASQAS